VQTFTAPLATSYKIECWGAQGGTGISGINFYQPGGKGGYVSGFIFLGKSVNLYLYLGGHAAKPRLNESGRTYEKAAGGWNGGGAGDYDHSDDEGAGGGGGATDIRLNNGEWNSFNSLKSRIMVAGAGGGSGPWRGDDGGCGGGLSGIPSSQEIIRGYTVTPGGQTTGYKFGIGEDGVHKFTNCNNGGGGSGYYGGCEYKGELIYRSNGSLHEDYIGAGGSSYISGYVGCDAISSSSTEDNIIHTGQPNHYSGKVFTNSVMIAGNATMPKPKGGTESGHSGDGYCIISWISPSL